jgi:ABC-type transport system substrate-binding protein
MKKFLALLLAMAMTTAMLTSCGGGNDTPAEGGDSAQPNTESSAPSGNTGDTSVTIGYVGGHYSVYPSSAISDDFVQQGMVYDKLFEVDDTTGEYHSRILKSYEWTDDRTLVMTLKDGITFSDGKQMTAEDVLFSIHNYIDQGESTDKYMYFQYIDFDACSISDDNMTLTLVYQMPYGPAERTLNVAIMEKEFTEAHENSDEIWYNAPVGSGPYQITDCVKDSYVTFSLRADYWDTDYTYDASQITLKFYSDETAMYMDYQAGNLDAIYGIGTTVASQIQAAGGSQGTVQFISNNDVSFVILNEENEYLADPAVREAIAYALDMSYITDVAYGLLGTEAKSHYASTFDCYSEHEGYTTDIDKAKQILADAGYTDGQISLRWVSPDMAPQPQVGEAIQAQLQMIGINVSVEKYDLPTALGMYLEGESDIMMMTVNGGNPTCEPYQSLSAFAGGAPFTCMSIEDPTYNSYLETGLNSVDTATRWEAYKEADQWLYDNYNALPICETLSAVAYNSRIASFDQSAVGKGCLGSLKLS